MGSTIVASKTALEKAIRLAWLDDLNTFGEDSYVYNNDEKLKALFGMKEAINSGMAGQRVFAYGAEKGLHVGNALALINGIGSANWAGLSTVDAVLGSAVAMGKVNANKKAINLFNRARGYIPANYLESDGNQYINTGFIPNQNTRVVCKLKMEVGTSAIWAFGARTDIGQNAFGFYASGNGYYAGFYGTTDMIEPSSLNTTEPVLVELNKNVLTIDGANTVTATTQTFTPNIPMYLFGCNTNGTLTKGIATIYYCQIYDGETLVRDFVPAKDFSGVGCMYDKVTKQFFYNEGTGVFADDAVNGDGTGDSGDSGDSDTGSGDGGGSTVTTPSYTQLDYVMTAADTQNDGYIGYVDTGIVPTTNTRIVADFEVTSQSSYNGYLYGADDGPYFSIFSGYILYNFELGYFGGQTYTSDIYDTSDLTKKYSVDHNKLNLTVSFGSNNITKTFNNTTSTAKQTMYLFRCRKNEDYKLSRTKLYSFKMYENDVLVRDFLPVKDADGTTCLFDNVTNEFYYMTGGTLIAGSSV